MMKYIKNVVVLTVITVIAGFLLGYVYDITKQPIEDANERILSTALGMVFPEGKQFDPIGDLSNAQAILSEAGYDQIELINVFTAKDDAGTPLGYVLSILTSEGYGGEITVLLGIKNDGSINGLEILSINETPGLGMNANTDEFKSQFKGKSVAQISYTKTGAKEDYEIDALSGATITTNAMTNAVNAGLKFFNVINANGGEVNE